MLRVDLEKLVTFIIINTIIICNLKISINRIGSCSMKMVNRTFWHCIERSEKTSGLHEFFVLEKVSGCQIKPIVIGDLSDQFLKLRVCSPLLICQCGLHVMTEPHHAFQLHQLFLHLAMRCNHFFRGRPIMNALHAPSHINVTLWSDHETGGSTHCRRWLGTEAKGGSWKQRPSALSAGGVRRSAEVFPVFRVKGPNCSII